MSDKLNHFLLGSKHKIQEDCNRQSQKYHQIKKQLFVKKLYQQIQVSQKAFHQNVKNFKGSKNDTNLLNINFKTIICRVLQPMCITREVSYAQTLAFTRYKQSPPSFINLIQLIYQHRTPSLDSRTQQQEHGVTYFQAKQITLFGSSDNLLKIKSPQIFVRLKKLFQSSQILIKIYQNDGSFLNKLLMLKYVEAIRYSILGGGYVVKWKQLRKVSCLK